MNSWLIVPHDPLIFRDGKPFTPTPGERAKSLSFPFPSTLAGAVRTRSGTDPQNGFDASPSRIDELLKKSIHGPLLVELDNSGNITKRYFPAPADALLVVDEKNQIQLYRLAPIKLPQDAYTDLSDEKPDLALVGHIPHIKDKPYYKAPRYWNWDTMQSWLENASDLDPTALGMEDLPREYRSHVSIDPGTYTAREGALFQTSAMEFTRADAGQLNDAHKLALALETDADLDAGVDSLGGERRIVDWQKTEQAMPRSEHLDSIRQNIVEQQQCRLILVTPAYFKAGYLPDISEWDKQYGVKVWVEGVALSRYQTISGWDYKKGNPKPTRRLVPAGSVYFLKFDNQASKKQIEDFVDAVWMNPISDDKQSRNDGFGLALLGVWENRNMEVIS